MSARPEYISIGRIGRAHGVRGEVRVQPETDFAGERFVPGASVLVGRRPDAAARPTRIETVRRAGPVFLVRFDLAATRDAAQALTGSLVLIPEVDAKPLGPDEYYIHQLLGLAVVTTDGAAVGRVTDFIETGSADVLVIAADAGRSVLVPMTGEVIAGVDIAAGRLTIHPVAGLLD